MGACREHPFARQRASLNDGGSHLMDWTKGHPRPLAGLRYDERRTGGRTVRKDR